MALRDRQAFADNRGHGDHLRHTAAERRARCRALLDADDFATEGIGSQSLRTFDACLRLNSTKRSKPVQEVEQCPRPYTGIVGIGKLLIVAGLALVVVGVIVSLAGRLPFRLGRLPGDIYYHGRNSTFVFPLMTCILLSLILSFVMWLLRR